MILKRLSSLSPKIQFYGCQEIEMRVIGKEIQFYNFSVQGGFFFFYLFWMSNISVDPLDIYLKGRCFET